jgi:protein-L-isoaspartate(D-aspartate) O-methyltransferase
MNGYLTDQLIREGYLKSPKIIEAFRKIKRADFVPKDLLREKGEGFIEEYNAPLSIGYEQTISQPLTVALMLELLQPAEGDKILDIGSGSGWQTAMLCQIVGEKGFVYAIERIPELKEFGQNNVAKYNFIEKGIVEFICGDGSLGLPTEAPFDKIIAAAAAEKIPQAWREQLKIGGRLVTPVENSIWLLIKKAQDEFEEKEYPGFSFVPLVTDDE